MSPFFLGTEGKIAKRDSLYHLLWLAFIQVHTCIFSFTSTDLIPERPVRSLSRDISFNRLKERKRSSYFIYETQDERTETAGGATLNVTFHGSLPYV